MFDQSALDFDPTISTNEFGPTDHGQLGTLNSLEGSTMFFEALDVNMASYVPGDQHLYSYRMRETADYNNALNNAADQFYAGRSNNHGIHPSGFTIPQDAVANVIAHGLDYRPDASPIALPSGWQDPNRGTFSLRCRLEYPGKSIPILVRGYTSHNQAISNGRNGHTLPHETVFFVNDVSELKMFNGVERFINITKELRAPDNFSNGFEGTNASQYASMTPGDVMRHIGTESFSNDTFGDNVTTLSGRMTVPVGSAVANNSAVAWASSLIQDYHNVVHDVMMNTNGSAGTNDVNRHLLTSMHGVGGPSSEDRHHNMIYEFLTYLSHGGDTRFYDMEFNYSALMTLDPTIDDRTSISVVSARSQDGQPLIQDEHGKYVNPYNLEGFASTSVATSEVVIGTMIGTTVASILQRASVTHIADAVITTRTMNQQLEVILPNIGLATANQMIVDGTVQSIRRAIVSELSTLLFNYGDVTITGLAYYQANVLTMNIALGDGFPVPFAMPIWADSLTSPVIQNVNSGALMNGQPVGSPDYETTLDTLSTTLLALSPLHS